MRNPSRRANSDFQRKMWDLFAYNRAYDKNELAVFLNKAPDTILAYCEGEIPLHLDDAVRVIEFIHSKNSGDTTLVDVFNRPGRFVAVPEPNGIAALPDAIHELSENITIMDGEIKKEHRAAKANDGLVDSCEFKKIEKKVYSLIRSALKWLWSVRREVR